MLYLVWKYSFYKTATLENIEQINSEGADSQND